jgi:vacuolar-type H+-ATPase subunit E/Vma4
VFYVVFLICTLGGLAYALQASNTYEYVSLVQVAQKDSATSLQAPAIAIATLENRWLPEVKTTYRTQNEENLPFSVKFDNPENTGLIRLSTETTEDQAEQVEEIHKLLIQDVNQYQEALVKREQVSLERQISSLSTVAEALKQQPESSDAYAAALQKSSSLEIAQQNLESVEVLVSARQSADKTGPKRSLIVILATLLGGMLGVFMVFMVEFGSSVKRQLAEDGHK